MNTKTDNSQASVGIGSTAMLGSFALHHSTDGLIARLNAMADDEDDEWAADVLRQSANKLRDMREVMIRVSKEADFSQCIGLEDAVDFVLSGLPNVAISHARTADENSNPPRKSGS